MNKVTKITFLTATLYMLFLLTLLGYGLFEIKTKGAELDNYRETVSDHAAKEMEHNNLMRIIQDTEDERSQLNSFFITEKDTITFISEMERAASVLMVKLETTELAVREGKKDEPSFLVIGFRFTGSEDNVKKFATLLENTPYHKFIPSLNLTSEVMESDWKGEMVLHITIL